MTDVLLAVLVAQYTAPAYSIRGFPAMCQAHTLQEGKATKFLHSWTAPFSLTYLNERILSSCFRTYVPFLDKGKEKGQRGNEKGQRKKVKGYKLPID
jgi:hypothetical protein